jgi:hypothetical protein
MHSQTNDDSSYCLNCVHIIYHYQFLFGFILCDVSVSLHFQSNYKPLEKLKVSAVWNGVMKEFPAVVNAFTGYMSN